MAEGESVVSSQALAAFPATHVSLTQTLTRLLMTLQSTSLASLRMTATKLAANEWVVAESSHFASLTAGALHMERTHTLTADFVTLPSFAALTGSTVGESIEARLAA